MARILIVEDESILALTLSRMVEKEGHEVVDTVAYGDKVTEAIDFDGETLDEFKVITSKERYREFSIIKALLFIPNDYFKIRTILRKIKKNLKLAGLPKIVRKGIINSAKYEIVLTRRIGLLRIFHKLFRYWHIAHLPFAITMFVIMLVHVGVTLVFGYKWIF